MNFKEKQELLVSIESDVEFIDNVVNKLKALAVDTSFFRDGETVPTIYVLVEDNKVSEFNTETELTLANKFEGVTFDIVGYDYYIKNISGVAQIFYKPI